MTRDFASPIATLSRELLALVAADSRQETLAPFARLLRPLATATPAPRLCASSASLPACRHLDAALEAAHGPARPLASCVRALAPALSWTQNPNYVRDPPSPSFLDTYGYAVIAGPEDGAASLVTIPDLAFGVLLLGPRTEYPAHHHPAVELYVPLGRALWRSGETGFRTRRPGALIYHAANIAHATRTTDAPLAALYLWAGDLATNARLVGRGSQR